MAATPEKLDRLRAQAFPKITCEQCAELARYGQKQTFSQGETVWEAGTRLVCMFLVLSGGMAVHEGRTGEHLVTHEAGAFSGDIDVLSGRPVLVRAVAETDLEVVRIPGDCVRRIVGELPEIGALVLKAFMARRAILQLNTMAGPLVVGSRFSKQTLCIREFFFKNRIPFEWRDLEDDKGVDEFLKDFEITEEQTPLVILPNGDHLLQPTLGELGDALGIHHEVNDTLYDLAVIGAGPAGLAAAVYGASEGLKTIVFDSYGPGGQAGTSSRIENYMGFPEGLSGQMLTDRAVMQAERFGAEFLAPCNVVGMTCAGFGGHEILLQGGEKVTARAVIMTTGVSYRRLDVDNLADFEGRGVYYSATYVERMLCGESAVAVVGGGNSAGQAAVYMAENAGHVFLIVRGKALSDTMSSYLSLRIERSDKITVLTSSEVCALEGDRALEAVTIVDRQRGQYRTEKVKGIFVMIGAEPHTSWLPEAVTRDSKGFILTGPQLVKENKWKLDRPPFLLETSCPGVFAAGDTRANSVKRVASAVGEGSMAVALVHQFLAM